MGDNLLSEKEEINNENEEKDEVIIEDILQKNLHGFIIIQDLLNFILKDI